MLTHTEWNVGLAEDIGGLSEALQLATADSIEGRQALGIVVLSCGMVEVLDADPGQSA